MRKPDLPRRALLAAPLLLSPGMALAQAARPQGAAPATAWPDRPVRLVVGFPPGGPTDFIARAVAPGLAAAWGQPVVVENRAGANAIVATEAVAKSPPDGHTLMLAANNHSMNPAVYARMPYDPVADFAPVGSIAISPNVFWVGSQQPWRNWADVLAAVRARPGALGYATTGNGGNGHFGGVTLARAAGIEWQHVPYRGTAPALQDVVSGQVPLLMQTLVGAIGPYRNGQLRPIAVLGPRRAPELPDTPTFAELGLDVPDSGVWYGMLAPAATPQPLVRRMAGDLAALLRTAEVEQRLAAQASVPLIEGPEEFGARIRADVLRWAAVAREAGMKAE